MFPRGDGSHVKAGRSRRESRKQTDQLGGQLANLGLDLSLASKCLLLGKGLLDDSKGCFRHDCVFEEVEPPVGIEPT
ncbi:hypothetical protein EKK58_00385 [Candidatus Dependentiae bacterium]|nr:MAG: hypothetical protein EKK58_00385 [Candidatus Dependentiae bacterium]